MAKLSLHNRWYHLATSDAAFVNFAKDDPTPTQIVGEFLWSTRYVFNKIMYNTPYPSDPVDQVILGLRKIAEIATECANAAENRKKSK